MKNTFGNSVCVTLFGESHGPALGIIIDGLAPGLDVDEAIIAKYLTRRRPQGPTDTPRQEKDNFRILSGVKDGKTCGTPIAIEIPNENTQSKDYNYGFARPSHADYTAFCKYHGYEDYRGGGHFSARITAALVAAGGIMLPVLEKIGVHIGTHIVSCAAEEDRKFAIGEEGLEADIIALQDKMFPVLDDGAAVRISDRINEIRQELDSVGGMTETAITGLPAGMGEPWFDSVESIISHAIFSIGAIKGIEFGEGFKMAGSRGSEVNDPFRIAGGKVYTKTNNNGGINGGITNGMPVVFKCAVKPTPSISREQKTINFVTGENVDYTIKGRHDPAVIRRICPVIDSMTAIVICDILASRYGTDILVKGFDR